MLSQSDFPVEQAIQMLAEFGVEAAYIVPTATGLEKSILDAHQSLRDFLVTNHIHDFSTQGQGQAAKRIVRVNLIRDEAFEVREMSLYRPETKSGDPRVWIGRLKNYAAPGNLLAFILDGGGNLHVVNLSDQTIRDSRSVPGSPLNRLLTDGQRTESSKELLSLMEGVAALGFVESKRPGDTGVGFTLESLLGIRANSNKAPDYKGIEIKASRRPTIGKSNTRQTLFAKTPDWKKSSFKTAKALLESFGMIDPVTSRRQFYTTVSSHPNPSGIYFSTDPDSDLVEHLAESEPVPIKVVQWSLRVLQEALAKKHRETFWVSAVTEKTASGSERFHYTKVVHTRRPLVHNLAPLIDIGCISMDYTLSELESGRVRDHGYLFRIDRRRHHLMFPDPVVYELV